MPYLVELEALIQEKLKADPSISYVAKLASKGKEKIAQKVLEEAGEVAITSVANGEKAQIISESADLMFHLLVLLAANGLTFSQVIDELKSRKGVSGLVEKAARGE